MNQVREYRMPLLIAGGALVVVLILWVALISPQNSKLASLQAQGVALQAQESSIQSRLDSLRTEGMKLSSNCADLQKISTQIPSVQTPTDIDAQESSFESQFNVLAASSGVTLAQFSGFAPASSTAAGAAAATPATGTAGSSTAATTAGVTAVPTTLTVQGNYGQMMSFINGLDSFPRLFVIQKFLLAYGTASTSSTSGASSGGSSSGASSSATPSAGGPPLWVGGTPTSPSAGPYNLNITGSIYYTSTPNALAACSKATAAQQKQTTT
jgi:Tfp pilus assembly protein PilO